MTAIRTTGFVVTAPGQTNALLAGFLGTAGNPAGAAVVVIGHDIGAISATGTEV